MVASLCCLLVDSGKANSKLLTLIEACTLCMKYPARRHTATENAVPEADRKGIGNSMKVFDLVASETGVNYGT